MNHFSASSQSGFNLVEVLVALVVLSFGLLGIAGLQITGVRGSQSSLYRSQAVVFMSDMSERIYSNRPGALAGAYAALNSGGLNCDSTTASACGQESSGAGSSCSAADMAAYDLISVACGHKNSDGKREGGVNTTLPGGRLVVQCIANNGAPLAAAACVEGSRHRVSVQWSDRASADNAGLFELATHDVTMTVLP